MSRIKIRTMAFALVALPLVVLAACTNRNGAASSGSTSAQYADYLTKATARDTETHAKAMADMNETHTRNMALMDRAERDMDRSEQDQKRFEQVLDTWEKQQAQYQKYLDSLPKHP